MSKGTTLREGKKNPFGDKTLFRGEREK